MASTSRSVGPESEVLPATEARQGRPGRPVLWVLLISTALAALALVGAWVWRADDLAATAPNNAREPADAQAFDEAAPAPVQTPSSR